MILKQLAYASGFDDDDLVFYSPHCSIYTAHCVKSVRIWSLSGQYFSAFGLNTP